MIPLFGILESNEEFGGASNELIIPCGLLMEGKTYDIRQIWLSFVAMLLNTVILACPLPSYQ
jgi:hypothetical protein